MFCCLLDVGQVCVCLCLYVCVCVYMCVFVLILSGFNLQQQDER